jgi:hypothetical protein
MELLWKYNPEYKTLRCDIDADLYYTSNDAGFTIHKFYKQELVKILYSDHNVDTHENNYWDKEVIYLSQNYTDIVGKLYRPWHDGYLTKDGKIIDIGIERGNGVVSPDKPISIDRLCMPANIMEWWDYSPYAFGSDIDDTSCNRGIIWYQHNITKQIVRTSVGNCPIPNETFPIIHGPFNVDEDDIKKHDGIYFDNILNQGLVV